MLQSKPRLIYFYFSDHLKTGVFDHIKVLAYKLIYLLLLYYIFRQPKAEWLARAGTVRASGRPPWLQERAIVGLVKSPVEGSTLALVKLETPLIWSHHVHSVCLPETSSNISSAYCTTLGWASTNREYLQRVELNIVDKSKCDNISISSFNSICTDVPYSASCDVSKLNFSQYFLKD